MRYHEILTEAKLTFSLADFEKASEESEFGVVYITMTGDGSLHLGEKWHARGDTNDPEYHPDASWRRSIKITLIPKKKEIQFREGSVGESLKPKVQQALRTLRDKNIIDNTWKITTTRQAAQNVGNKFVHYTNPIDEKGLDALTDKALRLTNITKDMVFYHGTSTLDFEKIKKVGLHPLGYGSNTQYGSESRGKHEGNNKVLYLAGSVSKALDYAKLRVADWNKKLHGSEYIYDQNNDAIVLAVQIPDPARLVADDDAVNEVARRVASSIWKNKSKEDREAICNKLSQEKGFKVNNDSGEFLWRETEEGFAEIMSKIPSRIFKTWKASLQRRDQVGYKGIIPPKFIKKVI
jgi:hypothetical protein